jgi:hypothetical protein
LLFPPCDDEIGLYTMYMENEFWWKFWEPKSCLQANYLINYIELFVYFTHNPPPTYTLVLCFFSAFTFILFWSFWFCILLFIHFIPIFSIIINFKNSCWNMITNVCFYTSFYDWNFNQNGYEQNWPQSNCTIHLCQKLTFLLRVTKMIV